jgi:hypothetical protein
MKHITAALLALVVISCSETDPVEPTSQALLSHELTFLRFDADAYQAAEKQAGFWAVRGQSRSLQLRYTDTQGVFLTFEVGPNSLVDRDSVYITVNVDAAGELAFHFEPSGLQFNNNAPARLRINHARSNPDIDADSDVDLGDLLLSLRVGVWKRELPILPWLKLPSLNLLSDVTEVRVHDFTSFGMAVD